MNWIILIIAGLCETGFAFCLGKSKLAVGTPCFIIGLRKDIRKQIGKSFGDTVHVEFCERNK